MEGFFRQLYSILTYSYKQCIYRLPWYTFNIYTDHADLLYVYMYVLNLQYIYIYIYIYTMNHQILTLMSSVYSSYVYRPISYYHSKCKASPRIPLNINEPRLMLFAVRLLTKGAWWQEYQTGCRSLRQWSYWSGICHSATRKQSSSYHAYQMSRQHCRKVTYCYNQ